MASQERNPYPLYNTSFTLHRVSPLYTGRITPLDNGSLQQYAKSLRDVLLGDVLRGVRVGLGADEDILARVGALQTVTWHLLPEEELWDTRAEEPEETTTAISASRGILVTVTYEKTAYSAILLAEEEKQTVDGDGFQYFPLLLARMPASLRGTFTDYLSSTFDVRVSPLLLQRPYLTSTLEEYISECSMGEDAIITDISRTLRSIIKDVQIVIGFDYPIGSPSLKTVDFMIAREDIPRLVQSGRKIARQEGVDKPFMSALGSYVNEHLALDLGHDRVKILKVACGAFVLGAEGKAKFMEPVAVDGEDVQGRATRSLIGGLVRFAKGGALSKVDA